MSIWYDRWTPGNTGTKIHVAYQDAAFHDIFYRGLDTSDDSLGTERTVFAGASFETGNWNTAVIDITKARGGNLYIGFWGDSAGEYGFYRSTDGGATWTSRADVADGNAVDGILLMPGNETDEDDIWCVYWDRSANELTLKVYDDSGDSWSESVIATGVFDDVSYYQMSAAPRHSDNHVILAAWDIISGPTADLWVYDLADSAGDVGSVTRVLVSTDEAAGVAVLINQQNDDIYVAYMKGGTWEATVDVFYKKSTDGGTTWGAEQSYSEAAADDIRALWAGISVGANGGRFQPTFFNDDLDDLFVNIVNDVYIGPSVLPLRDAYVGASVDAVPQHGRSSVDAIPSHGGGSVDGVPNRGSAVA